MHLLGAEDLSLVNPSFDHSRDGRHGKDHTGNLLIQSERELTNEGELLLHSGLHTEILEVSNILLEPIVGCSGLLLECHLSKSEESVVGGYLGVEGVERGLKVCGEFVEGFLRVGNGSICHLIIPGLGVRGSSSTAHLVQCGHDLGSIGRIEGGVQSEVGLHGLDPSGGIIVLAREVSWEGSLELRGV